jgi:hypothetical protein
MTQTYILTFEGATEPGEDWCEFGDNITINADQSRSMDRSTFEDYITDNSEYFFDELQDEVLSMFDVVRNMMFSDTVALEVDIGKDEDAEEEDEDDGEEPTSWPVKTRWIGKTAITVKRPELLPVLKMLIEFAAKNISDDDSTTTLTLLSMTPETGSSSGTETSGVASEIGTPPFGVTAETASADDCLYGSISR